MEAALTAEIARVNKKYPGSVVLGKDVNLDSLPRITSGSLSLDVALGGGWCSNQWNEIYGDETHGKTAIVLKTVAVNQVMDPNWVCLWAAAEPFNAQYAQLLGCDCGRVVLIESNAQEFVFQEILEFAGKRLVDCVVIDSLPALIPESEDERSFEEMSIGLSARLNNKFFVRKQRAAFQRSLVDDDRPVTGLVVNQFREKIGVMRGDPRTTPGGRGKNFAAFTRVEVRRDEWIEEGDVRVGQTIKARIVKNKSAPPQKVAVVDFYFEGPNAGHYDAVKEVAAVGILFGVVEQHGAYYHFGGDRWHGRAPLIDQLREDVGLRQQISEEVLTIVKKRQGQTVSTPVRSISRRKK